MFYQYEQLNLLTIRPQPVHLFILFATQIPFNNDAEHFNRSVMDPYAD